ncbi:unnamed protein product [marine sediment metagenome]|uniref:Uncharacterized protein n=1 Tax=marine sediment metagenome TaxID=412755 RepID=X1AAK9_9ZZZZ
MEILELIIVVLSSSLLGSILGPQLTQWYKTQSGKDVSKYYKKEKCFFTIVTDIGGFRSERSEPAKKENIYKSYRQLWLYASDETIRKINEFFFSMGAKRLSYDELTKSSKGHCELILQIRKDFYGETKLKPEDYQIVFFNE